MIVINAATPAAERLLRERLTPDGIAYLRLPRGPRATLARAAGLELGPTILEVRGLLVPAQRDAVRWAFARTATVRGRFGRHVPAGALSLLGGGAIARSRGARPLAAWLQSRGAGTAAVAAQRAAFLVDRRGVALVAKVGTGPSARRSSAEAEALDKLGNDARNAGAEVPVALEEGRLDGAPFLLMTGVQGTPASALIAVASERRMKLVARLSDWLTRWNLMTAVDAVLSLEFLEREVIAPARGLGLPERYVADLRRLCSNVGGGAVKFVAAHNDLTSANVLVSRGGRLGIVDWETAERRALPLGDLLYAVADAEAAATAFVDRPGAFLTVLADRRASELESRLAAVLGLDRPVADLCFHACWLRHAANEASRGERGEGPFVQIARTIAEQRIRVAR